jgi:hypothetical protein
LCHDEWNQKWPVSIGVRKKVFRYNP